MDSLQTHERTIVHESVRTFIKQKLPKDLAGMKVLEVGSRNVNGGTRHLTLGSDYTGIDIQDGINVDEVRDAARLPMLWGSKFDIVICTETLEHIFWWQLAIKEMVRVLRANGLLLLTTRSPGFPKHEHPEDWWRFRQRDLKRALVNDMAQVWVKSDPQFPGLLVEGWK